MNLHTKVCGQMSLPCDLICYTRSIILYNKDNEYMDGHE